MKIMGIHTTGQLTDGSLAIEVKAMKSPARPKRNQVITELRTALESVTAPVVQDADSPIAMIRLAWPTLCGSALAAHTNPIALQAGELFVAASDDAWASALREVDATRNFKI